MRCCKKKRRFTFVHALSARITGTIERVSPADRYERIALCRACPNLVRTLAMCSLCGCFIFEKTWHREAECPEGLWPLSEEEELPFDD